VDRGILSLDTKLTELFPALKSAASRILTGFDESGQPLFQHNTTPITLAQMLNQSSGFGREFGPTVQAWKKVTDKGAGFVNSCKVVCPRRKPGRSRTGKPNSHADHV
jgi:CubicO group peptidase (beta-lactamase class C family)